MEEKPRPALDRVDRRILDLLQREGALSVAEVAARTGLSTTTCWRRIQHMEQAGVMGEWDFMLRIVTKDIKAYEAFYLDHLSKLPYVQSINSSVTVTVIKETTVLPID